MALDSAPEAKGNPHTLVVTGAALRAADLVRVLRVFQSKNSHVAKLFSKHIKLKDAIAMVKKTRIGIGVGTPSRLMELLDEKVLNTEGLMRVVVDFSRVDGKTRGILDQKETQEPFMKFLARPEIRAALEAERADLAFY
jgi:protein CMS1